MAKCRSRFSSPHYYVLFSFILLNDCGCGDCRLEYVKGLNNKHYSSFPLTVGYAHLSLLPSPLSLLLFAIKYRIKNAGTALTYLESFVQDY